MLSSQPIPFPQDHYNIIYADPPLDLQSLESGAGRTAASHYDVMSLEDIKALPVSALADDDCALFMWATYPNLREAFEVLDASGFHIQDCSLHMG